jgi:hypothetical protein
VDLQSSVLVESRLRDARQVLAPREELLKHGGVLVDG